MGQTPSERRRLRAFLADVGPGLPVLPWSTPREAASALGSQRRAAWRSARRRLAEAFLHPAPHVELASALGEVATGRSVVVYPGLSPREAPWFTQSLVDPDRPLEAPLTHNHAALSRARLYRLAAGDPFADRPVGCGPLFERAPTRNAPLTTVEELLEPNGVHDQLRMVLYRGGRVSLYVGLYRRARQERFTEEEHAALFALRPFLRRWSRVASAIGVRPLGDGALVRTLDALGQPAILLRRGRVLFANPPGRGLAMRVVEWDRAGRPEGFATTTSIEPGGLRCELVLPAGAWPIAPVVAARPSLDLPPSLARVAALAAEGLADKEIAERLGIPLVTARTYLTRALARLGLHGRRELMRRWS